MASIQYFFFSRASGVVEKEIQNITQRSLKKRKEKKRQFSQTHSRKTKIHYYFQDNA